MSARTTALTALQDHPAPPPVPVVNYTSHGRLLIIGNSDAALAAAAQLNDTLTVHLLPGTDDAQATPAGTTLLKGQLTALEGWLGAFNTSRETGAEHLTGTYDLVLDLGDAPWFTMHQPPQGYFAPKNDEALTQALDEIRDGVGEFEKPKFFDYAQKLCAHSRAKLDGCSACIDVCSTQAIAPHGDGIRVEPHLCMGCGACASVCPSGALRYNFPAMSYWGGRIRALLQHYHRAGGTQACLLLHGPDQVASLVADCPLPEDVLPVEVFHTASIGLDWLLGALALGANRVAVLVTGAEAPQYRKAMREQMALAEDLLAGLGYDTGHFQLIEATQPADIARPLSAFKPAQGTAPPAGFNWFDDKRTTLQACLDHFIAQAPATLPESLPLESGAPFGTVNIDGGKCTLCLSCVSACPASALQDGNDSPALRFVERNCLQCGLCEAACPEDAISLSPRLLLTPQAKQPRTLHEDQPFHCVNCGKPFGTVHMVGSILSKLAGHSMFATPEARRRLQMCGDCRVIDMMAAEPPHARIEP